MSVRFEVLVGPGGPGREIGPDELTEAYAWPGAATVRGTMIATVDGLVRGDDGRSGSLGNAADRAVFAALRAGCDTVVVGAGTALAEEYGGPPPGVLLVVVSARARIPERLRQESDVILATVGGSGASRARAEWGPDRVWQFDGAEVDPRALRDRLVAEGRRRVLHEGGPMLLTRWVGAGQLDELCLTSVPLLRGGSGGLLPESVGSLGLRLEHLLRSEDSLMSKWRLVQQD